MSGGRRRRLLRRLGIVVAVLVGLLVGVAWWLDATGKAFYNAGRETVELLAVMAGELESGDFDALAEHLDEDYRGQLLGLTAPRLASQVDGVRLSVFEPGETADKAAALGELRRYREGFEDVEELAWHVHRLERWRGDERVAVTRLEVIAKPSGEPRAGIDRVFVRVTLRPSEGDGAWRVAAAELVRGRRTIAAEPHLVDVAAEAGVDFENRYYPPFLTEDLEFEMLRFGPAGITAVDLDGDGWSDLFIPDGERSRLFMNRRDGTFEDVTDASGLAGQDGVSVGLFADFDNDGDKDAFISRTFTPNRLLRNDGGRFVDVTEGSGLGEDCCTTVASVADVDHDGDLDLYVGRYLDPRLDIPTTFYARNGEPNRLYLNDGALGFTDVTEPAGVGEVGLCLGTVFGDYDDDGDQDLYVVNDFGRKTLYRNDGPGPDGVPRFEDVTVETGTLAYGAGMSASFGDYDNDGHLDLYVAHIRSEHGWFAEWPTVGRYMVNSWRQGVWMSDMPLYFEMFRQSGTDFVAIFQQMASGNTLLRNRGDGTFEDTTWEAEANPPGWFWGSGFIDFDNDGHLDLYSANGWIYGEPGTEIELGFLNGVVSEQDVYKTGAFFDPDNFEGKSWHGHERNRHLRNQGDGTFVEIGRAAGSDLLLNSRGIAVADFWNRGAADLAVAASTDRHALLRNEVGTRRNWLGVELRGAGPEREDGTNLDAVGVRLVVEHGGVSHTREVVLGDGYGAQNTLRQVIGLGGERSGDAPRVAKIAVTWPRSGRTEIFEDVEANRVVEIVEGRGEVRLAPIAPAATAGQNQDAGQDEDRGEELQ